LNKLIKSDLSLPIIVLLVVKINTFQNVGKKIFQISPLIQKIYYQKKWKEEKRWTTPKCIEWSRWRDNQKSKKKLNLQKNKVS